MLSNSWTCFWCAANALLEASMLFWIFSRDFVSPAALLWLLSTSTPADAPLDICVEAFFFF